MRKTITMSVKEFIEEHKRLISILRNANPDDLKAEADRQEKEFEEYGLEKELKADTAKESVVEMPLDQLKQTIQEKSDY